MVGYIRKSIDKKLKYSAEILSNAIILLIKSNEHISKKAIKELIYDEMNTCFWRILYDQFAREDLKEYIQKVEELQNEN